jgi:hypothetical protein
LRIDMADLDDLEGEAGVDLAVGGELINDHPSMEVVCERHEPGAVRVVAARFPVPVRLHAQVQFISPSVVFSESRNVHASN